MIRRNWARLLYALAAFAAAWTQYPISRTQITGPSLNTPLTSASGGVKLISPDGTTVTGRTPPFQIQRAVGGGKLLPATRYRTPREANEQYARDLANGTVTEVLYLSPFGEQLAHKRRNEAGQWRDVDHRGRIAE